MTAGQDLPVLSFASRDDWEAWLAGHHTTSTGIWLKFAKKDSGIATVSHAQALDVALRYGWIDGQAAKFDDDHWLQRFTPRRPKSKWSKINRSGEGSFAISGPGACGSADRRRRGRPDRPGPPRRSSHGGRS